MYVMPPLGLYRLIQGIQDGVSFGILVSQMLVSCPGPTHFVEYGLVTFAGVLGPMPLFLSDQ